MSYRQMNATWIGWFLPPPKPVPNPPWNAAAEAAARYIISIRNENTSFILRFVCCCISIMNKNMGFITIIKNKKMRLGLRCILTEFESKRSGTWFLTYFITIKWKHILIEGGAAECRRLLGLPSGSISRRKHKPIMRLQSKWLSLITSQCFSFLCKK